MCYLLLPSRRMNGFNKLTRMCVPKVVRLMTIVFRENQTIYGKIKLLNLNRNPDQTNEYEMRMNNFNEF